MNPKPYAEQVVEKIRQASDAIAAETVPERLQTHMDTAEQFSGLFLSRGVRGVSVEASVWQTVQDVWSRLERVLEGLQQAEHITGDVRDAIDTLLYRTSERRRGLAEIHQHGLRLINLRDADLETKGSPDE